jgi:glutaredoxin
MAKDYLKEKNVPFEDVDVSNNPARAREMIEKSGQRGVPVIDVDGTIIIGFDKNRLETLLSK